MVKPIYIANCTVYDKVDDVVSSGMSTTMVFDNLIEALRFCTERASDRGDVRWYHGGTYSDRYLVDMFGASNDKHVEITMEVANLPV